MAPTPSTEPTATPTTTGPTLGSESGDASAQTGQSQVTETNVQVSSATTAGGTGSVSVENEASTTIERFGEASASSGDAAVAELSTTSASTQQSDTTLATSGDANATGMESENLVSNTTVASVKVKGNNSGDIKVKSTNEVYVVEGGIAEAQSGDTLAAPSSLLATPTVSLADATSASVTVTGLTSVNQVSIASTMTATPTPDATGAITVEQSVQAVIENASVGFAFSDAASASPTPAPEKGRATAPGQLRSHGPSASPAPTPAEGAPLAKVAPGQAAKVAETPTPTPTAGSVSLASSGSADATGLTAENVVNTSADVQVNIEGDNTGLITVLIETITFILNFGWAIAQSGDALAASGTSFSGGSAAKTTPEPYQVQAASGDAEATGAEVINEVNLSSSASVTVEGDNYNPIYIILDLFAYIYNLGISWAQSGDVQATGGEGVAGTSSSGAFAESGSTEALGLDATNEVNMSASASVDIEGSNYADIYIYVTFYTYIWNEGYAYASSGSAQSTVTDRVKGAEHAGKKTGSATGEVSLDEGGTSYSSSIASSGDATAEGQNSLLQVASVQYADANGSGGGLDAQLPTLVNELPAPRAADDLSSTPSDASGGVLAQSGNAASSGFQTGDTLVNVQIATASNPGSSRASATNSFLLGTAADADSSAESGFAVVLEVTPTPRPIDDPPGGGDDGSGGSGGDSNDGSSGSPGGGSNGPGEDLDEGYAGSGEDHYGATSSTGGRRSGGGVFGSTARVNALPRWPDLLQPPMPQPKMPRVASIRTAARPAGAAATRPAADPKGTTSKLGLQDKWPQPELPPMPEQLLLAGLGAGGGPASGGPGNTRGPIELLIWGLLGTLALGTVATHRGRAWLIISAQAGLRQARAAAHTIMGLILNF